MSLPKIDLRGKNATVTMMELRRGPGEIFDMVSKGLSIRVERNGKHVGTIVPPGFESEETVIRNCVREKGKGRPGICKRASLGKARNC